MRSMTGFGAAVARGDGAEVRAEARAVNHRYCDVRLHLPPELLGFEQRGEAMVRKAVERGRVEVRLAVEHLQDAAIEPRVDLSRARAYHAAFRRVAEALGYSQPVPLEQVLLAPGVVRAPEPSFDDPGLAALAEQALERALSGILAMRTAEGASLERDLRTRLEEIEARIRAVRALLPQAGEERRARLEQRLGDLLGDRSLDPTRLAQEVALLADRADVSEELTRLESHVDQMRGLFAAGGGVGRKLDFLLQEMHRESNTIGSKTSSAKIAHEVVALKTELERVREQAQNVE